MAPTQRPTPIAAPAIENTATSQESPSTGASRQPPKRINFTVKALAALTPPTTGRVYVYDTLIRGLAVCITANNSRQFYLYRWVNGRPERIKLGKVGEITIDQARRTAGEKLGMIAAGINPQRQKLEAREEATFGDLFTAFIEKYKRSLKPKSWQQDQENYDLHLVQWKNRWLSEITRADVVELHRSKGAKARRRSPGASIRAMELGGTLRMDQAHVAGAR